MIALAAVLLAATAPAPITVELLAARPPRAIAVAGLDDDDRSRRAARDGGLRGESLSPRVEAPQGAGPQLMAARNRLGIVASEHRHERHDVGLRGGALIVDGRAAPAGLDLPRGRWRLRPDAAPGRTVDAALRLRAAGDRIRVLAALPLEAYVAWTVASETAPGTPREALRAQAVVARSWALAAGDRHPGTGARLCDLAHCQALRGGIDPAHLRAAADAARATDGEVLRLPSGAPALAVFHAACGGHTADPAELFGGGGTGAAAVPDDGCPAARWRAVVPLAAFEAVSREKLGEAAPPERLAWRRGRGGFVVQVALGDRVASGETFARALDARMGHRAVRSSRFTARSTPDGVLIEGGGIGHGAGLCQAGAARRAAAGEDHRAILRRYFPGAAPGPLTTP